MTSPEVGCEQPLEDFDGGRLPCSVGPEQAETFARLNFKIQTANGFDLAVVSLAQVTTLDGSRHLSILTENAGARVPRCGRGWNADLPSHYIQSPSELE